MSTIWDVLRVLEWLGIGVASLSALSGARFDRGDGRPALAPVPIQASIPVRNSIAL